MKRLSIYPLLAAALVLCLAGFRGLQNQAASRASNEVLYLPSGRALNLLSFGYQNALSHYLWFQTINYFGKHYKTDRNYKWLFHMCELVTKLNSKAQHFYQFCGPMLAWEAGEPEQAKLLYDRAVLNFPQDWQFLYLRGFTKIFFLEDDEGAKDDFVQAAKMPGAHPVVIRLASKKIISTDTPQDALDMLEQTLQGTTDPQARSVIENRIEEVKRMLHQPELLEESKLRWKRGRE